MTSAGPQNFSKPFMKTPPVPLDTGYRHRDIPSVLFFARSCQVRAQYPTLQLHMAESKG